MTARYEQDLADQQLEDLAQAISQVREVLVEETGKLRKENNEKDVQLAAAKEAVQAEVKKAASASSDLEKARRDCREAEDCRSSATAQCEKLKDELAALRRDDLVRCKA